ncbi:MAG: tyrosine-type recombinase/integrase [Proteobacteria bacterium]|nr:tyrosine-type recombinase/integrase [Pseudomonadota bacterium]
MGNLEGHRRYCLEVEIPQVGTHGLRHSTSELYMAHGATRDDLRQLFAHSSIETTDRYVHNSGNTLHRVIQKISLFDPETTQKRRTLQLVENNTQKVD